MDKLKQWLVLTVVTCFAVAAAGWFLVVSPKRAEAADLRAQADQQVQANAKLGTQLEVLKAQAKDLPKEQAKLAAVAAKIPSDPALPSLVRALLTSADQAGVELVSVAPGAPVLQQATGAQKPVQPAAPGQQTAAAPAAAGASAGRAGQLAQIPLALTVVGGYFDVQTFLSKVEELSRAVLVTTVTVAPGTSPTDKSSTASANDGSSLQTTINANVFMAANRPTPVAATVPGAVGATAQAPAAQTAPVAK